MAALIMSLTLIYSSIKLVHLFSGKNPIINNLTIPAFYSAYDKVQLDDINFRMAFTVEGFLERKMRDDPRYVKWFVRLLGVREGKDYEKMLELRKCTEDDYADFSPPDPKDE